MANGKKKGPENEDEYEVGYGNPPKEWQWPPGQSGNPSGKKKQEEELKDKLKKIAGEEIVVHKNGTPVTMSNLEAMLRMAFMKANSGSVPHLKALLPFLDAEPAKLSHGHGFKMTEADLAVLETHADWRALIEQAEADIAGENTSGPHDDGDGEDDPATTY